MVESTDLFDFDNSPAAREMHRSSIRRVLVQGKVRSHTVVILQVSVQDLFQVAWPKYDDMIEALTTDRSDDAFCVRVLPR